MSMRTIRFIIAAILTFVVTTATVIMLGSLATAQSNKDDFQAVYPNSWQPGINQICPKDSQKIIIATFTVPRGQKINRARELYIEFKNGQFLVDYAYRVNKRRVEYYFFPESRKAKVLLSDFTDSLLYAKFTGYYYRLHLAGDCLEEYAG